MSDPNKKFASTAMSLETLSETLEEIISDLSALLDSEEDCGDCGNEEAECPDCQQGDADQEADSDV